MGTYDGRGWGCRVSGLVVGRLSLVIGFAFGVWMFDGDSASRLLCSLDDRGGRRHMDGLAMFLP